MSQTISDETIQLILSKTDIIDVIGEYVHLRKSGRNFLGLCPFHSEKTPSFSVSAEKQLYHCFGCGAGGTSISFLMDIEGYSFPQAVNVLADKAGISLSLSLSTNTRHDEASQEKELVLKAHSIAAKLYHHVLMERKEGEVAREYLTKRGFQIETIHEFQIGFAPESWDFLSNFLEKRDYSLSLMEKGGLIAKNEQGKYFDRFRNRIMFPIWDAQGNIIAFSGRLIGDGQPKYLNTPETFLFRKSKQLFNFHRARPEIRKKQVSILFEGYADVISAWQAGIHNVTATMGTSLSDEQARMIRRNGEQVIICFDGDQAGFEAITKTSEILEKHGCLTKVATIPENMDPDEYILTYGTEAFQKQILNQTKSLTAFLLDYYRRGRNLLDDTERMSYIQEALTIISKLPHAVERDHYLRQLSEEFSLSLDALKQQQAQIYWAEKKKQPRDKANEKWNNSTNSKRLIVKNLLPSFHNAERLLLAHMLHNKDITEWIQEEVGSNFNIDQHSALAAYLYSFYLEGNEPNLQLFLTRLHDSELIKLATEISVIPINPNSTEQELRDYVKEILTYPLQIEIERKEEEMRKAERQGDVIKAAQIAIEIQAAKDAIKQQKKNK